MRIGIVGGTGWIGGALGRALIGTGQIAANDLVILTRSGRPLTDFGHDVTWAQSLTDLVARSDVIVLSIRPQDWPALGLVNPGKLVISVMAGVPLHALPPRSIRALPNAAAEVRQSFTPWFASPDCNAADRALADRLLSSIGTTEALGHEDQLDLMTATSGAGPAYLALMARAIISFLVENGLPPATAQRAAEAMICSSSPLMAGKMDKAEALVQVFLDYKGTTAAGLQTATDQGFETALKQALGAATQRAKAMATDL